MRRAVVALAVLPLLAGGCTRDSDAAAAADASVAPQPGDGETRGPVVSRGVPAHVRVDVEGAASFSWEEEIDDLRVVTSFDVPDRSLRLLSVGLLDVVALGDGQLFRAAFDLVGSSYVGDGGTFEIPAGVDAADATEAASIVSGLSNAFLVLVQLEDPAGEVTRENLGAVREFRTALEPCALEVAAGERSGSLDCPALADADGEPVHLRLSWRLTG
ncbi:MAG: hypothetical protein ACRDUY_12365 [Nitriliruptorales bacterium]